MLERTEGRMLFSDRLRSVNERYPSMVYLGLAFWFAWSRVAWPTVSKCAEQWLLHPAGISYPLQMHLVTTTVLIGCLFLFALFERGVGKLLSSNAFLCAGGLLAFAGTGFLVCSLRFFPEGPMFCLACITVGVGRSVLLVRCMALFGMLAPQRVLLMTAIASCVAAFINVFFTGLPFEASLGVFCALPLMSLALLGLSAFPPAGKTKLFSLPGYSEGLKLTVSFWQFVLSVFFVSVAAQSVVYFNGGHSVGVSGYAETPFVDIAVVSITLMLIVYAVLYPRSYSYNNIYYPAILMVMLFLALLFVAPDGSAGPLVISRAAFQIFGLLIWCLLCYVSYQSKLSPIKVLGFGYGTHLLGSVLGYFIGHQLNLSLVADNETGLLVYLIVAILVLAISIAVYPPRSMKDLLSNIPDEDIETSPRCEKSDDWEKVCNQIADEVALTSREREVMFLLAKGRGGTYISECLGVSLSTIYSHTRSIYRKMQIHSREELFKVVENRQISDRSGEQEAS